MGASTTPLVGHLHKLFYTLDEKFFKELHEMKHEDEMRSKVLLYGVKRILAEKREESLIHKLFKSKKRTLAERWN